MTVADSGDEDWLRRHFVGSSLSIGFAAVMWHSACRAEKALGELHYPVPDTPAIQERRTRRFWWRIRKLSGRDDVSGW